MMMTIIVTARGPIAVGTMMTAGMAEGGGGITGITAIGTVTIAGPVIEIMTIAMGTATASPTTSASF
jgi:hypothetical protein